MILKPNPRPRKHEFIKPKLKLKRTAPCLLAIFHSNTAVTYLYTVFTLASSSCSSVSDNSRSLCSLLSIHFTFAHSSLLTILLSLFLQYSVTLPIYFTGDHPLAAIAWSLLLYIFLIISSSSIISVSPDDVSVLCFTTFNTTIHFSLSRHAKFSMSTSTTYYLNCSYQRPLSDNSLSVLAS